ncbi:hypothetical protein DAY19_11750 [Halobacteriovorax vibrionivorans]|uniref:Uncharacterized protein n=1 Tax=Halobacteriovorax vibrionivorans TaxID=2152716 RepID=A0ABY0IDF1_9BACT|nr:MULTISPECIES: super-infection exclusion protein B [Halobacteriovorax]RZF20652.1 hypothetical protein DAY19_11750 [Halobacteriovorax vibrionivorans]TGD48938.1 hypothetical protein EP118_01980 [Halobacteriovorax sp. Y22]
MDSIINLIKEFSSNTKTSSVVALFYIIYVIVPENYKLYIILKDYDSFLHVFGAIALCKLAVEIIIQCKYKFKNISLKKKLTGYLKTLSDEEKELLKEFIYGNTKSKSFLLNSGVVQGLVAHKIIYRSGSISTNVTIRGPYFEFNIQPWAWQYLNKNPHLLNSYQE